MDESAAKGQSGGIGRVLRLLWYSRPYALHWMLSAVLAAVVGALTAFRIAI